MTSRKLLGVIAGMAGICLIVGVQALSGFGEQLTAQIAMVLAAICYAGAAILGRGFQGLSIRWCRRRGRCCAARRS